MRSLRKDVVVLLILFTAGTACAQTNELPRSTPEAEGVSSKRIGVFLDSIIRYPVYQIHSVMVLRHGKVIAEAYPKPFADKYKHTMFSCSKTFISAAVGLAWADNRLRLTDRVAVFFPAEMPDSISPNLSAMTVRDLLTMSSGIEPDWDLRSQATEWIPQLFAKDVLTPGKTFRYDSFCTYLLSAIVQKVTGMKVLDYLKLKLFNAMHITDVEWEESPEGYNTGGWGLYIQPESMAKFGQLLLRGGEWKGKQLLPHDWVVQMMSKQIDNGGEGYGYQMWICEDRRSVRADGAFGQYIVLSPDKDMVVVITECSLKTPLHNIFSLLLPAVTDQVDKSRKEFARLMKKINGYAYPCVQGKAGSPEENALFEHPIEMGENEFGWTSLEVRRHNRQLMLRITDKGGRSYELPLGYGQWLTASTSMHPPYTVWAKDRFKGIAGPFAAAGCYAWTDRFTFDFKLQFVDWYSALEVSMTLTEKGAALKIRRNYAEEPISIQGIFK